MADPTWGKISTTQTDFPTNVTANWYFSWAAVSRLTGRIFHTWNGRDYIYNTSTNLWGAAGSTNNVGWRENYGCCHDSDLNVIHYSPGTSGPTEWAGAIKYDLGSLTWSTEASTGVAHAAHLWDPTRKTLRNFGGWTSNEALSSRVTNPSGAWTATNPSGTQPPLTQDGSRETCRRAVMDTRNGNMYVLADDRDLYKYTASTNAWSLVSVTGTKPEAFAVLGIHETANMLVAFCGDNSMVQADARVPTRTTRVLDLTALQWKLLATTSNDPLRSIMCQTILMWDPIGDRVICLQTEPGTAYSQVYALTATSVGTPPTLYTVTVTNAGTGSGSVTGSGAYQAGATVDLTATAATGSTFAGYSVSEPFIMPANDVAVTATFTLDTPPPPPPPPNDLNLLVRQWNPRPLPAITTNSAPFLSGGQTKDVNGCYDTQRRIMYLGTGDFTGAGGSQSGRPEIFAYRAETNTWSLVSGLSHPAGQITPNHPTDRGPMIYDSLRDRIWLHNAVPFPDTEGQFTPGGSVYMAGLLYLQLSTGVWSFVADRNWSSSLGGGAYDTASDSMLLFEQGGFGPGSGGRLRVVPLTNPVNGGTTYNLTASPTPTWTGAAGGWLVPQQPERTFFAWDNQARVLYIINRQVRLDAAGNVAEQRASMHSFSMVTRTWTMRTHAAALSSSTTLVPYSIFCWWDSNTSRVIWPVVTGPDGLVTQMLAYTPATDTWENMGGSFSNMRANCGFFIPSVNAAIGAGSVFDLTYSQTNLFLWLDGPAPPNTGGDVTAPSCTLTAPASAATISGAAVAVSASATDNVAVSRVDFYFDGALFATDSVAPYAVVLNTLSATDGQHTISARAVDTSTNVSTFSTVTVTVTNNPVPPAVPPVCTITSHANNDTVSGTITVIGTITDADGVLMGELLVNGVLNTKQDFGPSFSWDVVTTAYADGPMTLKIKGTDNSAAHDVGFSATITVNVVNAVADSTAPAVAITSPAPAAVISGVETVTVTATDAVGVVGGVDLYVDGVKVLTDLASPYSLDLDTLPMTNGSYDLVAKARDAAGNIGTSATVTVTVNNTIPPPSDTEDPVVSVLTPVAGAVSGTISLTASATDNVAVTFVSYYLDGVKLTGDFATPPYTRSLDTTALTAGTHSIQARARDADLNEGISAFVQIIVPAPVLPVVCAITSPTDGAVLSGTVSVVCTASHADGVARVDLWFRDLSILTLDTAPFTFSVDTTLYADGPGIFQVRGYTAGGANEGLGTADVLVTINNALPPTTGPTIVITSPTNGENVSGTIDVVVLTTGSPIRVVVDVGGVPLSVEASDLELLTDTPTISVDTTRVTNGLQPIIAHAYGIGALVGHSQTIYVTIGNEIPEVVTATAQQTTGGQDLWRNTARGFRRRRGRRSVHV